jgi:hypothetical protein
LIAILWLDHALFNANQRCGVIAHDRDAAKVIFRDKVKFAYENLPPEILERFKTEADNADELLFAHNNSSIRVATSMRSGTIHRLHISELGKIAAKYPDKAQEVMTGSIPAVPLSGILVVESTAEGKEGDFAVLCERAEKHFNARLPLTQRDYRFHFYAWWQEPSYRMDSTAVHVSQERHEYFDSVEAAMSTRLDPDQRAWYVATQAADFPGKPERMWQEYPSTPAEAFQVSMEGCYYANDMTLLRRRGGIASVPVLDMPVHTFWDIGASDGCAVWFYQELRGEDRFIDYYEEHDKDLRHYVKMLREKGYVFGMHFLPHDADYKRLGDYNKSVKQQLQDLMPGEAFRIVPRITDLMTGIYSTRKNLKSAWFDKDRCDMGIGRIDGYRKRWNNAKGCFVDTDPEKHNGCSEAADALRQWAQAKDLGMLARLIEPTTADYGRPGLPSKNVRSDRFGYVPAPPTDWQIA